MVMAQQPVELPPEPPVVASSVLPLADPIMKPALPVAEPRKVVQNPPRKAPEPSRRAKAEAAYANIGANSSAEAIAQRYGGRLREILKTL